METPCPSCEGSDVLRAADLVLGAPKTASDFERLAVLERQMHCLGCGWGWLMPEQDHAIPPGHASDERAEAALSA